MSKKANELPNTSHEPANWNELLEEMRREYRASAELTDEEKRFLDELENLPEEEWEPIACAGQPVSEAIIEERGAR